jgi:hypothetical protein
MNSPAARVRPDTPSFFIVYGDHDTLVPVESARLPAAEATLDRR